MLFRSELERFATVPDLETMNERTLRKFNADLEQSIDAFVGRESALTDARLRRYLGTNVPSLLGTKQVSKFVTGLRDKTLKEYDMYTKAMINGVNKIYKDIVISTTLESAVSLETDQQTAIRMVKRWAGKGVPVFTDRAGRQWSNEAYSNLITRNVSKDITTNITNIRLDENEVDLVIISQHAGSRESHYEYQGKIYSRSGTSSKYPPLDSTTYGQGADAIITGLNCRHTMIPWFEGLSTKDKVLQSAEENALEYKLSQRQRYLERSIRKAKQRVELLEIANLDKDDISRAKNIVKIHQSNMRRFIKDTGRTRQQGFEQLYYTK